MFSSITLKKKQKSKAKICFYFNLVAKFRHVRSDSPGDFFFGKVAFSFPEDTIGKTVQEKRSKTIVISTPVLLPVHDM